MKKLAFVLAPIFFFLFTSSLSAQSSVKAKRYAQKAGQKIMQEISPMFGSDVYTSISDIDYDPSSQEYDMEITVRWTGKTWFGGSRETFSVSGYLTVGKYGSNPAFEITSKNNAVQRAINNINGTLIGGGVLIALASLD